MPYKLVRRVTRFELIFSKHDTEYTKMENNKKIKNNIYLTLVLLASNICL